tara:strand:- start:1730 stop:2242 length:513 start_codon:yes stop_codon:yes gene_type:complete
MNSKKNIVLIGMMGSGKSTIGTILSKKLQKKIIDIDKMIETTEGIKISDIFKKKGEEYFRKIEEEISLKFLNYTNNIIALGGGAFLNKNVQQVVQKNNISFWLNWNADTIINRIINSKKRPLAFKTKRGDLKKIISERSKVYQVAHYKINCENFDKDEIIKKIINIYEKK